MLSTFLALDMNLIPQATKDSVPNFWDNKFSNDNLRILLPGYNEIGELRQDSEKILLWLQWDDNPKKTLISLLSTAMEYTKDEIEAEFKNSESIWFSTPKIEIGE